MVLTLPALTVYVAAGPPEVVEDEADAVEEAETTRSAKANRPRTSHGSIFAALGRNRRGDCEE